METMTILLAQSVDVDLIAQTYIGFFYFDGVSNIFSKVIYLIKKRNYLKWL